MLCFLLLQVPRGPPAQIPADCKKFRVLALDGGGVRCSLHCVLISRILQVNGLMSKIVIVTETPKLHRHH